MQSNNKKKICIVVSSLGRGGAQKSAALLSILLDNLGYDVHIVSVLNQIDYPYAGTLFNLGELKDKKDTFISRIKRLKVFKQYLKKHHFNCIIDNRSRVQGYREFIISKLIYKTPVIYVIHNYNTLSGFAKSTSLNRINYAKEIMVAVSNEARDKFKQLFKIKNISTIYNTFDFEDLQKQAILKTETEIDNYIIFFGRLNDAHKNISFLLEAYKASKLPENNIKLLLLGDGNDTEMLKVYTRKLQLQDYVIYKSYVANPFPLVKNARFSVLTSRFEGFPMSILESLCLGTPVVSVNCKSGPKEIIINETNGLLVEEYTPLAFANAMNRLILDTKLYEKCKSNTQSSIEKFSMKNVGQNWKSLIESIN